MYLVPGGVLKSRGDFLGGFDFFFDFFGDPPPRKQTQAYGQPAAGTHPTGMHSCSHVMSHVCVKHIKWGLCQKVIVRI